MNIKNLALIAALSISAHAADRKACIDTKDPKVNKIRFVDDLGKKHTLTLVDLNDDGPEALLEIRASAGRLANKEVVIETSEHKLVNIGVVDSTCVTRSRTQIALK